jgi:serine/threonine protein kinase
MAKDIALGLSWLHNISKIVHRDLKPANLLLDAALRVKITDFGFAQLRRLEQARESQPRGSVFWMAPELLSNRVFNESVDVFSYGIILWQLITRRALYDDKYSDVSAFARAVCVRHERPEIRGDDCAHALAQLMRACWAPLPAHRCSADTICAALDACFVGENIRALADTPTLTTTAQ